MARNKSIPDDRLIALIHSYFNGKRKEYCLRQSIDG